MSPLLGAVLLLSQAAYMVCCLPLSRRSTEPSPLGSKTCVRFRSAVCNSIATTGYEYTPFPHPLVPDYVYSMDVLEGVANVIIERVVASGCSPHAAKFLCFAYFPLCDRNKGGVPPIVPCKSLCEQVRNDCRSFEAVHWLPWDCDLIGNYTSRQAVPLCVDMGKKGAAATEPPTPADGSSGCNGCVMAGNVDDTNFWSENHTSVAKVTINSRLSWNGTLAYNATADAVYALRCPDPAVSVNLVLIVATLPAGCPCSESVVGRTYLIEGYDVITDSDQADPTIVVWHVPQGGVVSPWKDDYAEDMRANLCH